MLINFFLKAIRNNWNIRYPIVSEINGGWCYLWAKLIKEKIPNAKLFMVKRNGLHIFVKINNRYYDSESIHGVKDWRKLKSFNNDIYNDNDILQFKEIHLKRYGHLPYRKMPNDRVKGKTL